MAGIIKRQILKHLSRFTKNLSPEQIHLSTLRGEGQLTDLQLDEEALQNMLDLPTWLAIKRVYCNHARIQVQWTKLKTHPICLMLDKVEIEMKTCENPRPPNGSSPIALASGQNEYGFAEKVVEGILLDVGCVTIKIESHTFQASLQLWQLQCYSVSPNWQKSDLRFTRITHPERGEVLTFKQVTWQTLRIEADASESCEDHRSTPLRLLTNGGRLHIALKRRVKDCLVLSSKLSFILDDLLWVLTDSQLGALLSYSKSLSEIVQKSVRQRKEAGGGQVPSSPTVSTVRSLTSPQPLRPSSLGQYFDRFEVKETSYHLLLSKLDLHICDESRTRGTVSGGAIQLTLCRITLDYYPSHIAGQSCSHWHRVSSAMGTCEQWIQAIAEERKGREEISVTAQGHASPLKQGHSTRGPSDPIVHYRSVLVRVDDMHIHQVSSSGQTPQKPPLLSCGHIPTACSAVHLQYTEYYCLPGESFPVPSPALYIQLHGLLLSLATPSILWLNLFMVDLYDHLQQLSSVSSAQNEEAHRDIRLDGFNLKFSVPVPSPPYSPPERPSSVCAQLSTVTLTNTRQAPGSSLDLLQCTFRTFAAQPNFHWPQGPLHPVFISHAYPSSSSLSSTLWSLYSSGLSVYFEGINPKHQDFLNPIQFTAWACFLRPEHQLHVLVSVDNEVTLQLNHYQYLTLIRTHDHLQNLVDNLQSFDLAIPPLPPILVCVGILISEVSLSLLLPDYTSLGTLPKLRDSERSSLGLDMAEVGIENKETLGASPTEDEKGPDTSHGMEACRVSMDNTMQQRLFYQDNLHKILHVEEQAQMKKMAQDCLQGKELVYDSLLSTLGVSRETISLGKDRIQRFLKDTRHKENEHSECHPNAPLTRVQSQQSLDAASVEGFDAVSLDSEASDSFIFLLDSDSHLSSRETEGNVETEPDDASKTTKGPEPHQILLVTLNNLTSLCHFRGDGTSVSFEAMHVSCGPRLENNMDYMATASLSPTSPPCVTLNFDLGPSAAYLSPLALHNGFLQLRIQNFCSELPISSLTHIGPFLEDEQPTDILPMTIRITNSRIVLRDDGPRLYPSAFIPEPVTLAIENLRVQRNEDGIFCITGDGDKELHKEDPSLASESKEELQKKLLATQAKLKQQEEQVHRLLQELWKYNPNFHL
ncbi:bridge-like lipid transfer protein family member 3A [Spea bombifrons]|uniref:bridge-like lipid transfer protein family member 3A n=1 Tax=Spea bombifrons TaxID=233779 RepID=UPI002349D3CF|nr:bridge-like lipid transfer protein family member 3A [Spea bombifrons]